MTDPTTPPSPDSRERRAWRTDHEWSRLSARIAAQPTLSRKRSPIAWWAAAAVAIAAAGIVTINRRAGHAPAIRAPSDEITGTAATTAGRRTVVLLPDSSVVTLGPASTIRYSFGRGARDVALDGMAEFRVTHDSLRRFSVHARNAVVTDIGTEFVVRAYASDSSVRVAVASGIVSLADSTLANERILLRANEVGGLALGGKPAIVRTADASRYTDWVGGRLAFEDESLARVAVELGRWFGVNVRVASPALAKRRVSGTYAQPTLSHVLDAIVASLGATYTKSGNEVVIEARPR